MSKDERGDERVKIFLSYSRDDADFAEQVLAALIACDFYPLIDRQEMTGGEPFEKRLMELILAAGIVVFILSPSSAKSAACRWEVEQAIENGKRVIPVICRPLGEALPPEKLRALDYIYFYPEPKSPDTGFGTGLSRLVKSMNADLEWIRASTRLQLLATLWMQGDRPTTRLLSGPDITDAKKWQRRRPLTALQNEFVRASEEEAALRAGAEHQRLKAMAEAQAERTKALQTAERLQGQRLRLRIAAFSALSILAVFSLVQWGQAVQERERANLGQMLVTLDAAEGQRSEGNDVNQMLLGLEVANSLSLQAKRNRMRDLQEWLASRFQHSTLIPPAFAAFLSRVQETMALQRTAVRESEQAIRGALNTRREAVVLSNHNSAVLLAAFDDAGVKMATADRDGVVNVWARGSNVLLHHLTPHKGRVTSLAFSPDGHRLLTASADKTAKIFDVERGVELAVVSCDGIVNQARFNQEATQVALAIDDGRVRIVNVATGALSGAHQHHKKSVNDVVFTRDQRFLLSASDDRRIGVWDIEHAHFVRFLDWHAASIYKLTLDEAGSLLASGGADGWPQIWDITHTDPREWKALYPEGGLQGHTGEIFDLQFGPGARNLVTSSSDETARVWNLDSGESVELKGHLGKVHAARFGRDGVTVLTASEDGTARLWDTRSGQSIFTLRGHRDEVYSAQFDASEAIVTASADHTNISLRASSRVGLCAANSVSRTLSLAGHLPPWP